MPIPFEGSDSSVLGKKCSRPNAARRDGCIGFVFNATNQGASIFMVEELPGCLTTEDGVGGAVTLSKVI